MADIVHAHAWDTHDTQSFVALGLGRDEFVRYDLCGGVVRRAGAFEAEDVVRAFDFSPLESGLVGYGVRGGSLTLRRFDGGAPHTFRAPAARKCNAVAFSSHGLVAGAFDKLRQHESLCVFDANALSRDELVSTAQESVLSAAFVPSEPSQLVYATGRALREFDVRARTNAFSLATGHSLHVDVSPFNDNYLITYNDSGSVALWDRRMLAPRARPGVLAGLGSSAPLPAPAREPLLVVPRVLDPQESVIRLSPTRATEFAVRHTSAHIRRYVAACTSADSPDSWFVDKVFDVKTEADKVAAFDYALDLHTDELMLVCIRQSGAVFATHAPQPLSGVHFDPGNAFSYVGAPQQFVEISGKGAHSVDLGTLEVGEAPALTGGSDALNDSDVDDAESSDEPGRKRGSDDSAGSADESDAASLVASLAASALSSSAASSAPGFGGTLAHALQSDVLAQMQRRARAGYSLTPDANAALLARRPGLRVAWEWVSAQLNDSCLQTPTFDLRFAGVLSVWTGFTGAELKLRAVGTPNGHRCVDEAVRHAVGAAHAEAYVHVTDDSYAYRQLCLRLCGWDFGLSELEARLAKLEAEGDFEKAAGHAVFHNDVARAVDALAKSRRKSHRLMATAVAGYLAYKNVVENNVWREQCRRLASEASTPYLRAIFAYVADGSWLDVVDDPSLPLTERLGVALRFLPKKEVTKFLLTLTWRALAVGDLEALVLTGMTTRTVGLFQAYVDRTHDVQTVALLACYGHPRYLADGLAAQWIAEYRLLLDAWQYYTQRARLDIARTRLAAQHMSELERVRSANSRSQAFLRCSQCHKLINHKPLGCRGVWNKCPHCNHALPACGVCSAQLGPCLEDKEESDRWPTFCMNCNHGFHSVHARQWFKRYSACPVQNCHCLCGLTFI